METSSTFLIVFPSELFSIAAGKTFRQGAYEFNPWKVPNQILIRNTQTSESMVVPVATRLNSKSVEGPVVVFDKVENDRYFSELYLPRVDGLAAEVCKGALSSRTRNPCSAGVR